MPVRKSTAQWEGDLQKGHGKIKLGGGAFEGQYSFGSRFENGSGTNPEELIAAAHAGCFSMALSHMLSQAGFTPTSVQTSASVKLEKVGEGFKVTHIELVTDARVPNIDEKSFQQHAENARKNCPISQLLTGAPIDLKATLQR